MSSTTAANDEVTDVLYRIKRGLASYVSYLAACDMNQAFSEYVLYEPILRILTARGFQVRCEYPCPGAQHASTGDKKRLDFAAMKGQTQLAIEVKWARSPTPAIANDIGKLQSIIAVRPSAIPLLCIFGRKSHLAIMKVPLNFSERGKLRVADLGRTKYGCRIFQLKPSK